MKNKHLTERKALEICRDLWRWLAKNPHMLKDDWPGWISQGEMQSNCPCCEYVVQHSKTKSCDDCPLAGRWNKSNPSQYCAGERSLYYRWTLAVGLKTQASIALEIHNACLQALKALRRRTRKVKKL